MAVEQAKNLTLPFSETYLKQRHNLYKNADVAKFNSVQQKELAYLKIQERYPERFLPWPVQVNVLNNLRSDDDAVVQWSKLVLQRLIDARESNILLSRYERQILIDYTKDAPDNVKELKKYLSTYKPRTRLGLYQHPNGKEWYQSKLNYYLGDSKSPNKTLNDIQTKLANRGKHRSLVLFEMDTNHFTLDYLKSHCDLIKGLNWVDAYINLPASAKQCAHTHNANTTRLFLSVMEIDIGLHYQGWSKQQARVTLKARLNLTDFEVDKLIEGTVLYPAAIFSLTPFLEFSA
jgi:hypothetical protein